MKYLLCGLNVRYLHSDNHNNILIIELKEYRTGFYKQSLSGILKMSILNIIIQA